MKLTYDKEADAIYIEFQKGNFAKNKKVDDFIILDYDANGCLLGIELLNVSKQLSMETLRDKQIVQC
ncbi:DUF2283 domain-containing protein [Candidatus Woesearchaeota archaeon]|nr:DUF2283 domain-containing protein [Candidatus Woesearchaeota archaeon]